MKRKKNSSKFTIAESVCSWWKGCDENFEMLQSSSSVLASEKQENISLSCHVWAGQSLFQRGLRDSSKQPFTIGV